MKRSRYLSQLSDQIAGRRWASFLALLLGISNVMLAAWAVTRDTSEKTIVTPPVIDRAFWVHGDNVSPEYLEQMALFFADLALSYNPQNIRERAKLFLRYADPAVHGGLESALLADAEEVERNRIASVFYPVELRIRGSSVALIGDLLTMVGSKQAQTRHAAFRIGFEYRGGRLFVKEFIEVNHAEPFSSSTAPVTAQR